MKNKKTTAAGILLIVGALATAIGGFMTGDLTVMEGLTLLGAAIGGGGFLATQDGSL